MSNNFHIPMESYHHRESYVKSVNSYKAFANVSVEVTKNKFRLSYSNGKQSAKTFPTISWPVKFQKGRFN